MIKIEKTEVTGWESAIRGMRNPMNSWDKSDSRYYTCPSDCEMCSLDVCIKQHPTGGFIVGQNDLALMKKLVKAGTDHRKFLRMIVAYTDITAPLYWWAEMDTYKVGTTRNSCSFMHKGVSKPYTIDDFSVKDERVYEVLSSLENPDYVIADYPYETDEYKIFTDSCNRTYKVYRNGKIVRESYEYTDTWGTGRTRVIPEQVCPRYIKAGGYIEEIMNGSTNCSLAHHIVAETWIPTVKGKYFINHIDGNKQNNSVENLEWCTLEENNQHAQLNGLRKNVSSLHRKYAQWKAQNRLLPLSKKQEFYTDYKLHGLTYKQLAEKYNITPSQANNLQGSMNANENTELFILAFQYETLIEYLNKLRNYYLDTQDDQIFQQIRCLMPQGYLQRSTVMLNYEVLANIYHSRKNHRLNEWSVGFIDWIKTLPYSELITGEEIE